MRTPHQEYHYTVGSLPHGVRPDKPCWPWKEEETPEPRLSIWARLLPWIASWWR